MYSFEIRWFFFSNRSRDVASFLTCMNEVNVSTSAYLEPTLYFVFARFIPLTFPL